MEIAQYDPSLTQKGMKVKLSVNGVNFNGAI